MSFFADVIDKIKNRALRFAQEPSYSDLRFTPENL